MILKKSYWKINWYHKLLYACDWYIYSIRLNYIHQPKIIMKITVSDAIIWSYPLLEHNGITPHSYGEILMT